VGLGGGLGCGAGGGINRHKTANVGEDEQQQTDQLEEDVIYVHYGQM
jgi:hypothetical protein